MSRQLAQIGVPGQLVDVLSGGDVDGTGRLLSVAELQQALRFALTTIPTTPKVEPRRPEHPGHPPTGQVPVTPTCHTDEDQSGSLVTEHQRPVEISMGWGANPVPVDPGVGARPVAVTREPPPAARSTAAGFARFPVAELLRRRPRDRGRAEAQVLTGRWPGPRRVLLASLSGGTGCTTTAALMGAAASGVGVPVMLLDATGGAGSDLAVRAGRRAARREWTRMTGTEAEVDFGALRRRRDDGDAAVCAVTISGDGGSAPPAEAVAAGAAAAARSWPLVLLDVPHGEPAVRAAIRAGGPDLLVLVCRADPAEITDCCGLLRNLTGTGELDSAQRAVIAVRCDRRGLPTAARRALAGVCEASAGPLALPHVPMLVARRTAAQGPASAAAGRLLVAAVALTPVANVEEQ